jgi:mannobiose 2-epimerase
MQEFENELKNNILPFWAGKMPDEARGGFIGRVAGDGTVMPDAPKGAILNARILWTFAAAFRHFGNPVYLDMAGRAKQCLLGSFWDQTNGGVYWKIDCQGRPIETKKQVYAQGFALYGLSEYARATGDAVALQKSVDLYHLIERYSFDALKNGYLEAFTADWKAIGDMRLSEKDANEKKTMNTHLHILEPYTNLYRVWPSDELEKSLRNLIGLFLDVFLDQDGGHLRLFFDEDWNSKSSVISYGHDIEALWLLSEAASVLGDAGLSERVTAVARRIADAVAGGILPDGSLMYEADQATGHTDTERHWWVQAEAVVGFSYAARMLGDNRYAAIAAACWSYIKNHLVDSAGGEWFWSIKADGSVNRYDDKAGFWKCPYHNGRMCMEMIDMLRPA